MKSLKAPQKARQDPLGNGITAIKNISDVSREILLGVSLNTSPASSEKQIHLKYAGRQYEYGEPHGIERKGEYDLSLGNRLPDARRYITFQYKWNNMYQRQG